jgi:hypothetical protein
MQHFVNENKDRRIFRKNIGRAENGMIDASGAAAPTVGVTSNHLKTGWNVDVGAERRLVSAQRFSAHAFADGWTDVALRGRRARVRAWWRRVVSPIGP